MILAMLDIPNICLPPKLSFFFFSLISSLANVQKEEVLCDLATPFSSIDSSKCQIIVFSQGIALRESIQSVDGLFSLL